MNPIKWSANTSSPFDPLRGYAAQANAVQPRQRAVTPASPIQVARSKGLDTKMAMMTEDRADARMREQQDRMDNRSAMEFGQNMARDEIKYSREKELQEKAREIQQRLQDRQLNIDLEMEDYKQNSPNAVAKRNRDEAYHAARMAEIHFNTTLNLDQLLKSGTEVNQQAYLEELAQSYLSQVATLENEIKDSLGNKILSVEKDRRFWFTGDDSAIDLIKKGMADGTIPRMGDIDENSVEEEIKRMQGQKDKTELNQLLQHVTSFSPEFSQVAEQFTMSPEYKTKMQNIEVLKKAAVDMRRMSKGMTPQNAAERIRQLNKQLKALHSIANGLLLDAEGKSFGEPPQINVPPPPTTAPKGNPDMNDMNQQNPSGMNQQVTAPKTSVGSLVPGIGQLNDYDDNTGTVPTQSIPSL